MLFPDTHPCVMPLMLPGELYFTRFVIGNFEVLSLIYTGVLNQHLESFLGAFAFKIGRGIDDPAKWAGKIGNSWRTTDDINDTWTRF